MRVAQIKEVNMIQFEEGVTACRQCGGLIDESSHRYCTACGADFAAMQYHCACGERFFLTGANHRGCGYCGREIILPEEAAYS